MADYVPKRYRNIPPQSGKCDHGTRYKYRVSFSCTVDRTGADPFSVFTPNMKEYLIETFKKLGVPSEPVFHSFGWNSNTVSGQVLVPMSLDFDALCFSMDMMTHEVEHSEIMWWYGSTRSSLSGSFIEKKRIYPVTIELTKGPHTAKELKKMANKVRVPKIPKIPYVYG